MRPGAQCLSAVIFSAFVLILGAGSVSALEATTVGRTSTPADAIGPGSGGRGCYDSQATFFGVTTRRFPPGIGSLAVSRACNEEFPVSRLCEWADIFRALPPITLETDVLVAPNFESRPAPMCLAPDGGFNCSRATLMKPAACCGFPSPPPPTSPASIILTPSGNQTVTTCSDTFEFTATAYDDQGAPMSGVGIGFLFRLDAGEPPVIIGYFNPSAGVSDEDGRVFTTLSIVTSTCELHCAGAGKDCGTAIQAFDSAGVILSAPVTLIDAIP